MKETRDESNRICRRWADKAKDYLSDLKGLKYIQYRKEWEFCGSEQVDIGNPLQLNIELTANCNLRCRMCYRNYDIQVRDGTLPLSDIKLLAQEVSSMKIPSVWLSGGEPLMHPEIEEVLKTFSSVSPLDFWMVTNGLLLSPKICKTIIESELTWLSVSIDASNAQTYKKIRGGSYDTLIRNIDVFLDMRRKMNSQLPFLRVSFIKMEENSNEESEFVEYWKDKADIIDIQTLADYHNLEQFSIEDVLQSDYKCTAPFTLISVLPNGDIIPCCNGFYGEKSRYNIHNTSLSDYWNSSYHKMFAQAIKEKHYCKECINCIKSFLPRKK